MDSYISIIPMSRSVLSSPGEFLVVLSTDETQKSRTRKEKTGKHKKSYKTRTQDKNILTEKNRKQNLNRNSKVQESLNLKEVRWVASDDFTYRMTRLQPKATKTYGDAKIG